VQAYNTTNMAIYKPLQVGTIADPATVPQYVIFKGSDSVWDLLLDLELFRDQTATQYTSVLLESFYLEVDAMADAFYHYAESRSTVFVGHSLGATYAYNVYARLLQDYDASLSSLVDDLALFNGYILVDHAWTYLKDQPADVRSKITHYITFGDFASVNALDGDVGNVVLFGAEDAHHTDNDMSVFSTLREYVASAAPTVTRDAYNSVAAHRMSNWTDSVPPTLHTVLPIDLELNTRMYFLTDHMDTVPNKGVAVDTSMNLVTNNSLNLVPDGNSVDYAIANVTVPDETKFALYQMGTLNGPTTSLPKYWISWTVSISFDGNLNTTEVLEPHLVGLSQFHLDKNDDPAPRIHFKTVPTGGSAASFLKLPTLDFHTFSTFPVVLDQVLPTTRLADIGVTASSLPLAAAPAYDFVAREVARGSNRRSTAHMQFPSEVAVGFTDLNATGDLDTYEVHFYLYDIGGGNLKWGHVNVGGIDNYKVRLEHISGDLFSVKSNTWDGTYTPTYEIAYYDTNRYSIKHTSDITGTKYLKRPTYDSWTQLQVNTIHMQIENTPDQFMDLVWEDWDGITGNPSDFLFTIDAYDDIKIPALLGDSLSNYDSSGTVQHTWLLYPQYLRSPDGDKILTMERNGNLIVWHKGVGAPWHANTYDDGNGLVIQDDGNVVVYAGGTQFDMGHPGRWSSSTSISDLNTIDGKRTIKINDFGKFQILDGSGTLLKEY
jgi:pimeloyl-ACP methyl ester carboxylesterase